MSLELHMDQIHHTSEKGLLVFDNDEKFADLQKTLYQSKKQELQNNTEYLNQARAYAISALEKHFTTSSVTIK